MSKFIIPLLISAFLIPVAYAQQIRFIQPIECTINQNCWIVNYVDVNPEEDKIEDFTCGPRSFDGHKGTDFALRSRGEMRDGVTVLAAADGIIERLRNGEGDNIKTAEEMSELKENMRECGNGIFIDHGQGIKTIYCHLKKDSLNIEVGDTVKAGDPIGEAGQSGMAEFPHLHFGIIWNDTIIDPFTGLKISEGCGKSKTPLWDENIDMDYEGSSIFDGALITSLPDFKAIEDGQPIALKAKAAQTNALVLWGAFYGVREGDLISLIIKDPLGHTVKTQNIKQEKTRARQYYYTGRKVESNMLPAGLYTGTITLSRNGDSTKIKEVSLLLE